MIHDAEDGAARAVSFEAAAAECADGAIVVCGTGHVYVAGDAFAEPFDFFFCGNAVDGCDFADKFVAGNPAKGVIATKNLNVGGADAGKQNANERPARAESRQRLFLSDEFLIFNREGEHERLSLLAKRGGE